MEQTGDENFRLLDKNLETDDPSKTSYPSVSTY